MDNLFAGILFVAFWLALLAGREGVPLLLFALAPGLIQIWFSESDKINRLLLGLPVVQPKLKRLEELGFTRLGVRAEQVAWRKAYYEVALTSVEQDTFASIMLGHGGQTAEVYFYTPFEGGGLVFTRGLSPQLELESQNTSAKNIPGGKVEALLNSHRRRVQAFKQRGLKPLPVHDQAARLAATRFYYASAYGKRVERALLRAPAVRNFALTLALLAGALGLFLYQLLAG